MPGRPAYGPDRDRERRPCPTRPFGRPTDESLDPGTPRSGRLASVCAVEAPVVGVVGAGQLARMMQPAAIALGVPLRLLAEADGMSAAQVIADTQVGDYPDYPTLRAWAEGCAVVTFDHEHVPTGSLEKLAADGIATPARARRARPRAGQGRDATRGSPSSACRSRAGASVADAADVVAFAEEVGGFPVVLKTTRGGYDGKGVWTIDVRERGGGGRSRTLRPASTSWPRSGSRSAASSPLWWPAPRVARWRRTPSSRASSATASASR